MAPIQTSHTYRHIFGLLLWIGLGSFASCTAMIHLHDASSQVLKPFVDPSEKTSIQGNIGITPVLGVTDSLIDLSDEEQDELSYLCYATIRHTLDHQFRDSNIIGVRCTQTNFSTLFFQQAKTLFNLDYVIIPGTLNLTKRKEIQQLSGYNMDDGGSSQVDKRVYYYKSRIQLQIWKTDPPEKIWEGAGSSEYQSGFLGDAIYASVLKSIEALFYAWHHQPQSSEETP